MLVIFDFDGTLADSLDTFVDVLNANLPKGYAQITKKEIQTLGTKNLLKKYKISKWQLPLLVWKARKEMKKKSNNVHIFKGLQPVVNKLRTKHELAILTSNSKAYAEEILSRENFTNVFTKIDSSLAYFGKHKKIAKMAKQLGVKLDDCIYIGDETRDIEAAKRAGVRAAAVSWGYENRKLLNASKPDILLNSPKDLLSL